MGRRAKSQAEKLIEASLAMLRSGAVDDIAIRLSFNGVEVGTLTTKDVTEPPSTPRTPSRRRATVEDRAACSDCGHGKAEHDDGALQHPYRIEAGSAIVPGTAAEA